MNVDFIMARNMLYLGGAADSFAQGNAADDWNTMFNINAGYYF